MANRRAFIVCCGDTGANRGIGLAILQLLAVRYPASTLILGARSAASVPEALAQLKANGAVTDSSRIESVELDVASDDSIAAAVTHVRDVLGHDHIDVLVNNAGIAQRPSPDDTPATTRAIWASTLDVNVASVAAVTTAFAPLLTRSAAPTVLNISSGRASLHRSSTGDLPPTGSVPYSVSKTALNCLTLEIAKIYKADGFRVVALDPGHCKTAFNGFRGLRDPLEGARTVVEALDNGVSEGFWGIKKDGGPLERAPW